MEPIALIPELTKSLGKVARALAPWDHLARLEELLLRRARSAFLVAWFGKGVPVKSLNLYIVIANIEALRTRFRQVRASRPEPLPRMNLLGPLAGITGVLAGLFLSPPSGMIIGHELSKLLADISKHDWVYWLSLVPTTTITWLSQGFALGVIGLIGVPLALVAAVAYAGGRDTRLFVEVMGHFAMLIDAALKLWDQISGPRKKVRNPLLRKTLDFLDAFANFFAQVLGAVSLIVVRVFPLVPNLLAQWDAFSALTDKLIAALIEALSGIGKAITGPFAAGGGIKNILDKVFDTLMQIPGKLLEHLGNFISDAAMDLGSLFDAVSGKIVKFLDEVVGKIVDAFKKTPLGQMVTLIGTLVELLPAFAKAIKKALAMPGPPEPPDDGGDIRDTLRGTKANWVFETPKAVADVIDRATELPIPDLPDFSLPPFPKTPVMPDVPAIQAEIGRAGPVDYMLEAQRLLKQAREDTTLVVQPEELLKRPKSFFGPEMKALRAKGVPTITEHDRRLRNALYLAVGRVLPGDLRVYAPKLKSFFDMLDAQIYGKKDAAGKGDKTAAPDLPQQDLNHGGKLQPKVEKLRIRARNAQAPDLRAFRDRVVDRMRDLDYYAHPATTAGGG